MSTPLPEFLSFTAIETHIANDEEQRLKMESWLFKDEKVQIHFKSSISKEMYVVGFWLCT